MLTTVPSIVAPSYWPGERTVIVNRSPSRAFCVDKSLLSTATSCRSIWNDKGSSRDSFTNGDAFTIGVVDVQLRYVRSPVVVSPDYHRLSYAITVKRARHQQLTAISSTDRK